MASERTSTGAEPKSVGSVIAADMKITGECRAEGALRVDGTIEGTLQAEKSVVVTRTGVVRGQLAGPDIVVAGTVDGAIACSGRLELEATGIVTGELRCPSLRVGDGAKLNGLVVAGAQAADRSGAVAARPARRAVEESAVRTAS